MKYTFTFVCAEIGTMDMLDPEIVVDVKPGLHMYQRALESALEVFSDEYADRMQLHHIVDGRL